MRFTRVNLSQNGCQITLQKRDVIEDLIHALKQKNIKLILYIHPSDGHDFTKEDQERTGWNDPFPHTKWNNFINEVVGELADRYGDDIFGFFIDGGIPPHTEDRPNVRFDPPRLRRTIKDRIPNAVLIQNSGLNETCVDAGAYEGMESPWPASEWLMCQRITKEWWAMSSSVSFSAELAYKYTVLQAAVSTATGGGAAWSFGPHPDGRWEVGVTTFTETLGELVDKAGPSLLGSKPSTLLITEKGTPLVGLQYVATESLDGNTTWIHIFNPPRGNSITLPLPANGNTFSSAKIVNGGFIDLVSNINGIELKLKPSMRWDDIDTIIELK